MPSLADLKDSLAGVRSLIVLESQYADPPAEADRLTAFALRGACVVLTVAAFEAYLRSLFEEQLDKILKQHVPLAHFPEELRVEAAFASLELAMKGDHTTKGQKRAIRLPKVVTAARLVAAESFWPRALADTQSNPNSACVTRMFKSVGLPSILSKIVREFESRWGEPVALAYPETKLESLVTSRHQVAHTADAGHITRQELAENVRFIEILGTVLNKALNDHTNDMILEARENFLMNHDMEE